MIEHRNDGIRSHDQMGYDSTNNSKPDLKISSSKKEKGPDLSTNLTEPRDFKTGQFNKSNLTTQEQNRNESKKYDSGFNAYLRGEIPFTRFERLKFNCLIISEATKRCGKSVALELTKYTDRFKRSRNKEINKVEEHSENVDRINNAKKGLTLGAFMEGLEVPSAFAINQIVPALGPISLSFASNLSAAATLISAQTLGRIPKFPKNKEENSDNHLSKNNNNVQEDNSRNVRLRSKIISHAVTHMSAEAVGGTIGYVAGTAVESAFGLPQQSVSFTSALVAKFATALSFHALLESTLNEYVKLKKQIGDIWKYKSESKDDVHGILLNCSNLSPLSTSSVSKSVLNTDNDRSDLDDTIGFGEKFKSITKGAVATCTGGLVAASPFIASNIPENKANKIANSTHSALVGAGILSPIDEGNKLIVEKTENRIAPIKIVEVRPNEYTVSSNKFYFVPMNSGSTEPIKNHDGISQFCSDIEQIQNNPKLEVGQISITGHASPEWGSQIYEDEKNLASAKERATSVGDLIEEKCSVSNTESSTEIKKFTPSEISYMDEQSGDPISFIRNNPNHSFIQARRGVTIGYDTIKTVNEELPQGSLPVSSIWTSLPLALGIKKLFSNRGSSEKS